MSAAPLLSVRNLGVVFRQDGTATMAVEGASFDIARGETVALVGETGSGKSVTALSVHATAALSASEHPEGNSLFNGQDMLIATIQDPARGARQRISMIFRSR